MWTTAGAEGLSIHARDVLVAAGVRLGQGPLVWDRKRSCISREQPQSPAVAFQDQGQFVSSHLADSAENPIWTLRLLTCSRRLLLPNGTCTN